MGERLIQHKAKPSSVFQTKVFFSYGGALTGLKHFWSTNTLFWLLLVIQNVAHVTSSAVFSVRSAVFFIRSAIRSVAFSEKGFMENIACYSFDVHL